MWGEGGGGGVMTTDWHVRVHHPILSHMRLYHTPLRLTFPPPEGSLRPPRWHGAVKMFTWGTDGMSGEL